jgi:outer membrane protein assembly factor BamE (lipoprotein component of BamABCDE complex)
MTNTMKKKPLLIIAILIMIASCNRYVAPVFTDVDRISQLRNGMKLKQVVDILGIDPYNIYHMQENGSMLVTFNYRLKMRKMVVPTFNVDEFSRQTTNDDSQTSGEVFYSKDYKILYALIKDGDMVSFTTTEGVNGSEMVMIHNNNLNIIENGDISIYDNKPDSTSNAEAIKIVYGPNSFRMRPDKRRTKEKESLLRGLFKK